MRTRITVRSHEIETRSLTPNNVSNRDGLWSSSVVPDLLWFLSPNQNSSTVRTQHSQWRYSSQVTGSANESITYLGIFTVHDIFLTIQEPVRYLVHSRVGHDGNNLFDLSMKQCEYNEEAMSRDRSRGPSSYLFVAALASTFVQINVGLLHGVDHTALLAIIHQP